MMNDNAERAIQVALEVSQRRADGEKIRDDDVIAQHPDLQPFLEDELRKIRLMEMARRQGQPPDSGTDDIRFTRMVSDDEMEEPDSAIGFTTEISEPVTGPAVPTDHVIEKTVAYRPTQRPPSAILRIYHDDQRSFEARILRSDCTVIGRTTGDVILSHDNLISSQHAEIAREFNGERWGWRLRDLQSTNGTFVNVERAKLRDGDEVLLGSGRYRFSLVGDLARLQNVVGGELAESMEVARDGTAIGRAKSDQMRCFHDEHLDIKHAFIQLGRNNHWYITNMKSLNGVWFRVKDQKLFGSCVFQIGEQRFGFST